MYLKEPILLLFIFQGRGEMEDKKFERYITRGEYEFVKCYDHSIIRLVSENTFGCCISNCFYVMNGVEKKLYTNIEQAKTFVSGFQNTIRLMVYDQRRQSFLIISMTKRIFILAKIELINFSFFLLSRKVDMISILHLTLPQTNH